MSKVYCLKKKYQDEFLIDIKNWEIADEGISILWGPSGSGKSTIFRLLSGLERPDEIRWLFQGVSMESLTPPERRIGWVSQSYDLFEHLTAEENILFAAKARGLTAEEALRRFNFYAEQLEMNLFLRRPAQWLSGGEKQRVAIARALIGKPRILFLDEPFAALDNTLRDQGRILLKKVLSEEKIPALLVSHDSEDIEKLQTGSFFSLA